MDPVSVGLLVAVAGGAGGEIGRQAWSGLTTLVRRPVPALPDGSPASTGEGEMTALGADPSNADRAHALSTALAVRAALDADFRTHLQQWAAAAEKATEGGSVHNVINNSTIHGSAWQGRDFTRSESSDTKG
ncbi:hypothetical protein [Streptomyces fructofermentans]|uniref:Uncharacterized protein n=1 Tax=Streptomyces fructofermentans TaxID=152141 RepID=A0A918NTG3_9ACTN|nr:hypothetical protein [Streptomyces fructofermentans]GGX94838.1 hypothetical protein GCM10010515_71910 [Streptomyces fructofermentans]